MEGGNGLIEMLSFAIRRILQTIPTILAVVLLIFVLFSVIPGSFISSMGDDGRGPMDAQVVERMQKELGLNDPVHVRFTSYISKLAIGDFGTSFRTREPVTTMIAKRDVADAAADLRRHAVGDRGRRAARIHCRAQTGRPYRHGLDGRRRLRPVDAEVLARAAADVPVRAGLGWLPSFGYGDGSLKYLILPAVTLGVSPMALLARTTRAAVLEIMTADFVRTARSKGMSETRVVKWHVMRNALVLILTTIGLQFGALMGQAVVVEKLFSWPGIGSLLVDSVLQRDIPAVQGAILVAVLFFLAINTLVDLLYVVIDPAHQVHLSALRAEDGE